MDKQRYLRIVEYVRRMRQHWVPVEIVGEGSDPDRPTAARIVMDLATLRIAEDDAGRLTWSWGMDEIHGDVARALRASGLRLDRYDEAMLRSYHVLPRRGVITSDDYVPDLLRQWSEAVRTVRTAAAS